MGGAPVRQRRFMAGVVRELENSADDGPVQDNTGAASDASDDGGTRMPKLDSLDPIVGQIVLGLVAGFIVNRLVDLSIDLVWAWLLFGLASIGLFSLARDVRRAHQERRIQTAVRLAYSRVTRIHKPAVMNPDHPGNPTHMAEQAQQAVDDLTALFSRANEFHPGEIDVDDSESVREWYEFLRRRRKVVR